MAKRKGKADDELVDDQGEFEEEDELVDAPEDPVVDADGDVVAPETHICLEDVYYKAADPRQRVVVHAGKNYEHTHEDALGVWCYRNM